MMDISIPNIKLDTGFDVKSTQFKKSRYIKIKPDNRIKERHVIFENAVKLANCIDIKENQRIDVICSGNFVFGDFIDAYIRIFKFEIKEMTISTLSMSEYNVEVLAELLKGGIVQKLNLIISEYFFSHERHGVIKYIYEKLDIENRFQLSVARVHTKIAQFETFRGGKCVMQGSANLRSSRSIEQLTIEENKELYNFNQKVFDLIIDKYKTINKTVTSGDLYKYLETSPDFEIDKF